MNKRKKIQKILYRLLAVAALLAVVSLPLDWMALGKHAARVAMGLRQPEGSVKLLDSHLFDPSLAEPTADLWLDQNREDSTRVDLPVVAPVTTPAFTAIAPPGNKGNGGTVLTRKLTTGDRLKSGIATVNRSGKSVDVASFLKKDLPFRFENTKDPQVLILHTHTTEGYMTYDAGYYNAGDRDRTKDHQKNVCAVGEAIRLTLEAEGIVAIHDTTIHDSPQYTGAYTRSSATAEKILKKYPSIKVVLDIHRDAVLEEGAVVKPTATVDGRKAAQMMLVTGVVDTEALPHPQWQKNLTLSAHLQKALDGVSEDLMRPMNTVASRYNQHLSPGWLLVEVGAEGNTVEEAVYSGQILAKTLAKLLD